MAKYLASGEIVEAVEYVCTRRDADFELIKPLIVAWFDSDTPVVKTAGGEEKLHSGYWVVFWAEGDCEVMGAKSFARNFQLVEVTNNVK